MSNKVKINTGNNSGLANSLSHQALVEIFKNSCAGDPNTSDGCKEIFEILTKENDLYKSEMIKKNTS